MITISLIIFFRKTFAFILEFDTSNERLELQIKECFKYITIQN